MADGFDLIWDGDNRIINAFGELNKKTEARILNHLQRSATRVFEVSQREVPVDTGYLKASGDVTPNTTDGSTNFTYDVNYGDGVGYDGKYGQADGYAWFVELGTVNQDPQPYLGPAFEEESQKLLQRLGNILSED